MREIRQSGSEGGAGSHIPVPTPIFRQRPALGVSLERPLDAQPRQTTRRPGRNIRPKQLQDLPKHHLGNMRVLYVFVFH